MWNIAYYLLLSIHVIASIFLVFVVLMQRPRNEGLGTAFGGEAAGRYLGAGAADTLTKFTVFLGASFFVITLTMAILIAHADRPSALKDLGNETAVEAPAVPGLGEPEKLVPDAGDEKTDAAAEPGEAAAEPGISEETPRVAE